MMAFSPEAQTLLTVVATTASLRPALMAHWRAGAWPKLWACQLSLPGYVRSESCLPSGEHIAEEDFLDVLGLDLRHPLDSSCATMLASLSYWTKGGASRTGYAPLIA